MITPKDILETFGQREMMRLTARRLEHLASLNLTIKERTVLEVGAGIGDLTDFFLDRRCRTISTDARSEHVSIIQKRLHRYPRLRAARLNIESPPPGRAEPVEIVFCYGVLHLLTRPAEALAFLASCCQGMLLLECEVDPGAGDYVRVVPAEHQGTAGSLSTKESRATRRWIIRQLCGHFPHVYEPVREVMHPDYPKNWAAGDLVGRKRSRTMLIGSRNVINEASVRPADI